MDNKNKEDLIYLNTAAVGLVSSESISAANKFQNTTRTNASKAFIQWMEERLPSLRQKMAKLIHTKPTQIAFTPNFSFSIISVIDSLRSRVNKVLLYKQDYPSLNMPFELGGFDVHYVESQDDFSISLTDIKEITEREKIEVIAISHVQFLTGFTIDIEALGNLCKEKGIILIVDATQSLGAVELDFDSLAVDILISSSYKWLNAGPGSAVLCIKKSFMQQFPPRLAGFGSLSHSENKWSYDPSLASYEPGHLNPIGLLQLEKAVEQRRLDTVPKIEKHNQALLKKLALELADMPFKVCGGNNAQDLKTIICFEAEQEVQECLTQHNISVTWRKGLIRVSPHFYNTEAEILRFIEVLRECVK